MSISANDSRSLVIKYDYPKKPSKKNTLKIKTMIKQDIQNNLYSTLAKANINPITARYIAMRLQQLEATEINNIKQIETYKYTVTTNLKNYVIELHQLGLPDAKILEVS